MLFLNFSGYAGRANTTFKSHHGADSNGHQVSWVHPDYCLPFRTHQDLIRHPPFLTATLHPQTVPKDTVTSETI